jgi:hypothetical protein
VSPGRQLPESPIDRSRAIWASTELVDMWLLQCHSSELAGTCHFGNLLAKFMLRWMQVLLDPVSYGSIHLRRPVLDRYDSFSRDLSYCDLFSPSV